VLFPSSEARLRISPFVWAKAVTALCLGHVFSRFSPIFIFSVRFFQYALLSELFQSLPRIPLIPVKEKREKD